MACLGLRGDVGYVYHILADRDMKGKIWMLHSQLPWSIHAASKMMYDLSVTLHVRLTRAQRNACGRNEERRLACTERRCSAIHSSRIGSRMVGRNECAFYGVSMQYLVSGTDRAEEM